MIRTVLRNKATLTFASWGRAKLVALSTIINLLPRADRLVPHSICNNKKKENNSFGFFFLRYAK